jgi:hypothetical protein
VEETVYSKMPDKDEPISEQFSPEELKRLRTILDADKADGVVEEPKAVAVAPKRKRFSLATTPKWLIVLVGVVVAAALAFGYVKFIDPQLAKSEAAAELNKQVAKSPVLAQNADFLEYKPDASATAELPPGVNPKQLALGEGKKVTDTAAFVFASEKANSESHTLDLYIDFYSQRSRDFITLNKSALENKIQSGEIVLRVHPVLNSDPFSVYAPEALAEVFGTAPDKAWPFFTNLMKDSITLTGSETSDEIVAFINKRAQDNGAKEVSEASIVNATFLTWLYTAAKDPKVAVGYVPPIIYVDDKELDQDKWRINDPEQMLKLFATLN